MMARTPAQALAWAAANRGSTAYNGLCLKHVRTAYGIGAVFPSAIAAWNGAKKRHGSISTAPDGAPVYFSHPKSKYGHVALLRRVNGVPHIETTNTSVGRTVLQPISLWTDQYGYRLLGWTEDINGVDVCDPLPKQSTPQGGGGLKSTKKSFYQKGDYGYAEVKELQRVLNRWYPGLPRLAEDGNYGPKTEARVLYFQRKAGLKQDGIAGPATLGRLGMR